MAVPTDMKETNQGDSAVFTPSGGSAIEFAVLNIAGVGGVESSKGAEVTSSADFTGSGGSAVAKFAGDYKQTLTDVVLQIETSPTQFSAMEAIVGRASRGALVITALSGSTFGNASCDIISVTNAGGSTRDSEQNVGTVTISPSGSAPWAYA